MKYGTIMDTMDSINRAAAALNVTPNGGTFTAKQFNDIRHYETPTLDTMRKRGAIVVDHVETFVVSAKVTIDIKTPGQHWYPSIIGNVTMVNNATIDSIDGNAVAPITLLQTLADANEDLRKFFNDFDVIPNGFDGYTSFDKRLVRYDFNGFYVVVDFRPKCEGHRNFYRFDLAGFLKKSRAELNADADRAENKAKQLVRTSKEYKALAARIRDMIADINGMD